MSTIKSSDEHLTLNADGSSKDIKFQANGVEKASISSAGAFTSTTIDATKLTGTIPNFTSTGIDDNADATAITIDSSENVGIGATTLNNNFVVLDSGTEVDSGSNASNLTAVFQKSASAGTDCGVSIASGTTGNARLYLGDSGNVTVGGLDYDNNNNSLAFLANSSERMRIDSSGNVGIGQSTPSELLHIKSTDEAGKIRIQRREVDGGLSDNDEIGALEFWTNDDTYSSGASALRAKVMAEVQNTSSGTNLQFWTANTNAAASECMRIIADGNVGIGTDSPDAKLVVEHDSSATSIGAIFRSNHSTASQRAGGGFASTGSSTTSNRNAAIWLDADGANFSGSDYFYIQKTGGAGVDLVLQNAADMRFQTSGSTRMTIHSGGQVLVNRSSAYSSGGVFQISHSGASQYGIQLNSSSGGSGTHYHMTITRGDTQAGYLTSSPTSVGLSNSSDERLKENIQDSASATQDIKNIKVRQFDWKNDRDVHKDYGFVAQELVTVVPEAVAVGSDELKEDGTPVQIWGVDDSKLIPRLVKTIQELEARITTLEKA